MTEATHAPDKQTTATAQPLSVAGSAKALGCGVAMGTADAVPGVSGGTIALILGIYDRLIGSLGIMIHLALGFWKAERWQAAKPAFAFLVPLGVGMVTALYLGAKLLVGKKPEFSEISDENLDATIRELPGLLVNPATAPYVFAFFFGLVAASLREPWGHRKTSKGMDWGLALVGVLIAAGLSLSPGLGGSSNPIAIFFAGAIAISVMLLPGISGSLALLVLGMYQPVSAAVSDHDVVTLATFGCGVVCGAAAFIPLLKRLLARFHDRTMALLTGLMAGSLVALWPWKVHYIPKLLDRKGPMSPVAPDGSWWGPLIAALVGAGLIITISFMASRRKPADA